MMGFGFGMGLVGVGLLETPRIGIQPSCTLGDVDFQDNVASLSHQTSQAVSGDYLGAALNI